LAVTAVELDFLAVRPGIALGLGLLLPFHNPLFFGLVMTPLAQGHSESDANVCAASLGRFGRLEILAYHVGSFLCRSQINFGYSAIALHQHFHIVAESIGLG